MSSGTRYDLRGVAAWITLDQPESRNALTDVMIQGLRRSLEQAIAEPAVRVIVLTGEGTAFCAGADLKSGGGSAISGSDHPFVGILKLIWDSPKPVIGRINGHAFGGGVGLAAACDLTVAADTAAFSFSEVRIGVVPAMISVVVLPKIGIQNAMWLFLTAERFNAARAVEIGLIHRAVPAAELDREVEQIVAAIGEGGPNAVRAAKQLIRKVPQLPMNEAFDFTAKMIGELFASEEALEGMLAFREKRKPSWATARSQA